MADSFVHLLRMKSAIDQAQFREVGIANQIQKELAHFLLKIRHLKDFQWGAFFMMALINPADRFLSRNIEIKRHMRSREIFIHLPKVSIRYTARLAINEGGIDKA